MVFEEGEEGEKGEEEKEEEEVEEEEEEEDGEGEGDGEGVLVECEKVEDETLLGVDLESASFCIGFSVLILTGEPKVVNTMQNRRIGRGEGEEGEEDGE